MSSHNRSQPWASGRQMPDLQAVFKGPPNRRRLEDAEEGESYDDELSALVKAAIEAKHVRLCLLEATDCYSCQRTFARMQNLCACSMHLTVCMQSNTDVRHCL